MTPSGVAPSSICSRVPSAWSAAKRRDSESSDESSAATQITPGAMARSRFGSAPTPSGNRLATMTKNSSATATSLFCRSASSRSRYSTPRTASSIESDLPAAHARLLVGRIDGHAAACDVLADQRFHDTRRVRVERGERLVEQPQRPGTARDQPRKKSATALPLRKLFDEHALGDFQALQRGADGARFHRIAGKLAGDGEI